MPIIILLLRRTMCVNVGLLQTVFHKKFKVQIYRYSKHTKFKKNIHRNHATNQRQKMAQYFNIKLKRGLFRVLDL